MTLLIFFVLHLFAQNNTRKYNQKNALVICVFIFFSVNTEPREGKVFTLLPLTPDVSYILCENYNTAVMGSRQSLNPTSFTSYITAMKLLLFKLLPSSCIVILAKLLHFSNFVYLQPPLSNSRSQCCVSPYCHLPASLLLLLVEDRIHCP